MKTPMQEFIESITLKDSKDHIVLIPTISKAEIEAMLEKEKEVMCEFAYKCHKRHKVYGDFMIQEYYNETFNTEEK